MGTLKVNNIQSTTDGSVTFPQGSVNSSNSNITGNLTVGGTTTVNNVRLPDGNVTTPSVSFTSDTNTGLYRISEDKIGVSIGGVRTGEIGSGYGGFTGNIIQVQSGVLNTTFAAPASTFTDIGLSVSIIPRYNTSNILILAVVILGGNFWDNVMRLNLVRGSTNIAQPTTGTSASTSFARAYGVDSSNSGNFGIPTTIMFLDSPATTSSITYKIQLLGTSNTTYVNRTANNSNITGISTITVMEVQQ